MDVGDFATGMYSTSSLRYIASTEQLVGVSINLQHTAKVGQMRLRVGTFSVR